jgi:hypothetical protein
VWIYFGLPPNYRLLIHEEIFSLCYYGNGGFQFSDVYGMPVYLRRFYIKKLTEAKKSEAEQNA